MSTQQHSKRKANKPAVSAGDIEGTKVGAGDTAAPQPPTGAVGVLTRSQILTGLLVAFQS